MMRLDIAIKKREEVIKNGFCVIDNVLSTDFIHELQEASEQILYNHVQFNHTKYHGHHLHILGEKNTTIQKLLNWKSTQNILDKMGFDDFEIPKGIIILTKDPGAPPLFWHQDWYHWNDPISCAPWPQHLFMKYYLTDTTVENGCLRVLPGTHCHRIDLHDQLMEINENDVLIQDGAEHKEEYSVMFNDHPEQVDVCVKSGSLVLRDARLLHSVRKNITQTRRTMLLLWAARPFSIPNYWEGEIPEPILNRDKKQDYPSTRVPTQYLSRKR